MNEFGYELAMTAFNAKMGEHSAEIGVVLSTFKMQCHVSAKRGDFGMTLMYHNAILPPEKIKVLFDCAQFELQAAKVKVLDSAIDLKERIFKIDVSWK